MDAEHAALVARSVTEFEHDWMQDSGGTGANCPKICPLAVVFPALSAELRRPATKTLVIKK